MNSQTASVQFSLVMHAATHLAAKHAPLVVSSEPLVRKGQATQAIPRMVSELRDQIFARTPLNEALSPELNSVLEVRVLGINPDGASYSATRAIPGSKILPLLSTGTVAELTETIALTAGDVMFDVTQQRNRAGADSTRPHMQITATAVPAPGTLAHPSRTYYSRPLQLHLFAPSASAVQRLLLQLMMETVQSLSTGEQMYFEAHNLPLLEEPITEASFAALDPISYQTEFTLKMLDSGGKKRTASFVLTQREVHRCQGDAILKEAFEAAVERLMATEPALEATA